VKLVLFAFFINLVFIVESLSQGRVSIGAEVGFPTGSGSDGVNTGLGGSIRYEGLATKKLTWLLSAGYLNFSAKAPSGLPSGFNVTGSATVVPVEGGVKYFVNEAFKGFYIGSDLGIVFGSLSTTASYSGSSTSLSTSENKFNFAPMIGYHFPTVDLTFKYNVISDGSYFSLRAAYAFLGK
jgi:hypothetical protein